LISLTIVIRFLLFFKLLASLLVYLTLR